MEEQVWDGGGGAFCRHGKGKEDNKDDEKDDDEGGEEEWSNESRSLLFSPSEGRKPAIRIESGSALEASLARAPKGSAPQARAPKVSSPYV